MAKGEPTVTQAPVMDPKQLEMLQNLITGVMGTVQGFPLGQAYGGPYESSFGVRPFDWTAGQNMGLGRDIFGGGSNEAPSGGRTRRDEGPGVRDRDIFGGGRSPQARESEERPSAGGNEMGGDVIRQQMLTRLLTNPFMDPFRQEMTGNYPIRRMR